MADSRRPSKRAKKTQAAAAVHDTLTPFLTTELSTQQNGRPPLRLAALIYSFLTVPELMSNRGVSLQWHQLFGQFSCGNAGYSFTPNMAQLTKLAERDTLLTAVAPSLLTRLGCQRNVFQSLNHLTSLDLSRGWSDETPRYPKVKPPHVEELLQQLAACSNLPLLKLVVPYDVTAAVLSAVPSLLRLEAHTQDEEWESESLDALIHSAPPTLRHCRTVAGFLQQEQVEPLGHRFEQLESLSVDVQEWEIDEVYTLLAACQHVVSLTIMSAICNTQLMDILCDLPKLRQLEIVVPDDMTTECLYRIPELRASMVSRLSEEQQREELNGSRHRVNLQIDYYYIDDERHTDEYWWSLVQASQYCTIELSSETLDSGALRRYEAGPALPQYVASLVKHRMMYDDPRDAFVAYVQLHCELFYLMLPDGHELNRQQLADIVSHSNKLHELVVSCRSPAVVRRALTRGKTLTTSLQKLDIRWPVSTLEGQPLTDCLQLVRQGSKLTEVTIRATVGEWQGIDLKKLLHCTAHVATLNLVAIPDQSTLVQQLFVTHMFLALPNLTTLSSTESMTRTDMNAARAQSGLQALQGS